MLIIPKNSSNLVCNLVCLVLPCGVHPCNFYKQHYRWPQSDPAFKVPPAREASGRGLGSSLGLRIR